jgi:putative heme degradation protein
MKINFIILGVEDPMSLLGDLDTPLPVSTLEWVASRLAREQISLVLHLPCADGWVSWPVSARELPCLMDGTEQAWVAQRPDCTGLVTRLVLLDEKGQAFACLAAERAPGQPEPVAWRVTLLMALLAAEEAPEHRFAAGMGPENHRYGGA